MRKLPIIASALVLAAAAGFVIVPYVLFLRTPVRPPSETVIHLPAGTSLASIAARLEDGAVVSDAEKFRYLARFKGAARQLQAGEYAFSEPATPLEVLQRLTAGDVRRHRVTIPEGFNLREIEGMLQAAGFGDLQNFANLARDAEFAASLGVEAPTLEGYLFPETYTFVAGTPVRRLLESMVAQFRHRLPEEVSEACRSQNLDLHQLVTLASIIQKEAGNREEMPLISAVFHNRLKRGMPLQADPTVIYGIENFDGNITRRHLAQTTPYNTYRIRGLPPGPIASPGAEALEAAAFPAQVDYLYFVSRGDGTHVFSRTLEEHNRAVRRFQLKRK